MTSRERFELFIKKMNKKRDPMYRIEFSYSNRLHRYVNHDCESMWRVWQEQQKKIEELEWELLNYRNGYTFVEQRNEIKRQQKKIDALEAENAEMLHSLSLIAKIGE